MSVMVLWTHTLILTYGNIAPGSDINRLRPNDEVTYISFCFTVY